jgi:putative oxidoreductase
MERAHDGVLLLGRLLVAALFLPAGFSKLLNFSGFAASLADKGLPYSQYWAAAAITIEVLGPIALAVGLFPRWTAFVLFVFVVAASATSHRYWEFQEPARRVQEVNFFKNAAILGGLLFYFVSGAGHWGWTPRFRTAKRGADQVSA